MSSSPQLTVLWQRRGNPPLPHPFSVKDRNTGDFIEAPFLLKKMATMYRADIPDGEVTDIIPLVVMVICLCWFRIDSNVFHDGFVECFAP